MLEFQPKYFTTFFKNRITRSQATNEKDELKLRHAAIKALIFITFEGIFAIQHLYMTFAQYCIYLNIYHLFIFLIMALNTYTYTLLFIFIRTNSTYI